MPPSHNSIFAVETKDFIPSGMIDWFNNPIPAPDAFEEGNLANISPTIKIDISIKPGVVEEIIIGAACTPEEITAYKALFQEFRDIFAWSYTEMPGIDPSIVEHRIDTWPDITPVCQKQRPLHPAKASAIKAEVDKLRTAGFIYPIAYTSWVSNPVPVDKKQGTIHVCTDFRDLNNACPKDNFPTPFIDQIIDDCAGHEALSFMGSASRHLHYDYPWATFHPGPPGHPIFYHTARYACALSHLSNTCSYLLSSSDIVHFGYLVVLCAGTWSASLHVTPSGIYSALACSLSHGIAFTS
jgi:hypothetical protein